MSLILNKAQAEAVYSAMRALNNVGGGFDKITLEDGISIYEYHPSGVGVSINGRNRESYDDQAAFAAAYGLVNDEPQSAVAAAAGGLTQTAVER